MMEQSTEGLGLDRRQVLTRAWKAALSLSTLGVVVAGAAPPAGAGESQFSVLLLIAKIFTLGTGHRSPVHDLDLGSGKTDS